MPCGHGGLFLFVVWAASGGGKAGPVMGLRPLLGPPCIPPEAPRLGFPASDISRGLRGYCCGSFLASLGDLPARRAMPLYAFALDERPGRHINSGKSQEWRFVVGEKRVVMKDLNFEADLFKMRG